MSVGRYSAGPLLLLISAARYHQAAGLIAKPATPILGFSTCTPPPAGCPLSLFMLYNMCNN